MMTTTLMPCFLASVMMAISSGDKSNKNMISGLKFSSVCRYVMKNSISSSLVISLMFRDFVFK